MQRRRLRAGRLLLKSVAQAEVARRVGVMRTTVSEWNEKLEDGGARGAEAPATGSTGWARFHAGRELIQQLRQGALAAGFGTELWTLPRVGQLIEQRFARRYSESQVWRILMSLGVSCQRPSGRALERDESAIQRWKQERWPALKKRFETRPNDRLHG